MMAKDNSETVFKDISILKPYTIENDFTPSMLQDKRFIQINEHTWIKILLLDVHNNRYINLLCCTETVHGPWHYHHGRVNALVLKGIFQAVNKEGEGNQVLANSFMYEPPGIIHKPRYEVDEKEGVFISFGCTEGAVVYLNNRKEQVGYSDVFTQLDRVRQHYKKQGISSDELNKIIC